MKWEEQEESHWWYRARREMVSNITENKRSATILDLGCGNGALFNAIPDFKELVGVDNSRYIIRQANKKAKKMPVSNINLVIAKGDELCFKKNSFDTVICADVLEHIEDDYGALLEIRDVLRKKGEVIITIPAFKKLWGRQDEEQKHYRRYHLFEIKYLIESSGLKLTYLRYWNSFLMPFAVIFRRMLSSDIKSEERSYSHFNSILYYLLKMESVINFIPFGVSLIVKAQKP